MPRPHSPTHSQRHFARYLISREMVAQFAGYLPKFSFFIGIYGSRSPMALLCAGDENAQAPRPLANLDPAFCRNPLQVLLRGVRRAETYAIADFLPRWRVSGLPDERDDELEHFQLRWR